MKFVTSVFSSEIQFGLSFNFDVPTLWNDLPNDVRHSPSLTSFRKQTQILHFFANLSLSSFFHFIAFTYTGFMTHELCLKNLFCCTIESTSVEIKRYKSLKLD